MNQVKIKAIFSDYEKFIAALKLLAKNKNLDVEVLSPMPLHEVQKILPQKPSRVRWFTFLGGLIGLGIGIGFPIYTVKEWPLITGGKPLVTMPAFIIVAFELLILAGAIFTLLGLFFTARLPRQNLSNYDIRFSENSFGIILQIEKNQVTELKKSLKEADELVTEPISN